jgi:energy-coupling factor transporter ATP-binding protein EcfA2
MYVSGIQINRFRHIEDVRLGPYPGPGLTSDLVALAGPNGGGKSSILELLGYALSQAWSLGWSLRRTFGDFSFEVALGLTKEERQLVREFVDARPQYASSYAAAVEYLSVSDTYYRGYNFPSGQYDANQQLYNQIHQLATDALRNANGRPSGFFLKADRYYPPEGFQRDRLFAYQSIIQREYIWSMAYQTSDVQYRDMFEYLIQERYHYLRRLGAHYDRVAKGLPADAQPPTDPLRPYDELLQRLFPGYEFAPLTEDVPSNLFITLPSGQPIPFADLSSGEKEVFFILSFFLRHNVKDAVVLVDEPELHLHPELARLLVATMQSLMHGNQIWLATHNPEVIDETGRDRTIYVSRDSATLKSNVLVAADEPDVIGQLKNLFGYSGYIGVAKSMVFLEGTMSSPDRKLFSAMFPEQAARLKFVPSGGSETLTRINAAVLAILESNLGWVSFYMVRDRDFLTDEMVREYRAHTSGRIYVLDRAMIENYLLDDQVISRVLADIFGRQISPHEVGQRLRQVAIQISGEVLREMLGFRLNLLFRPTDFSVRGLLSGQSILDVNGALVADRINVVYRTFGQIVERVSGELGKITDEAVVRKVVEDCADEIRLWLIDGQWRHKFPGKRLLEVFASLEDLGRPIVLVNSLIKEFGANRSSVPSELVRVVSDVIEGRPFGDPLGTG